MILEDRHTAVPRIVDTQYAAVQDAAQGTYQAVEQGISRCRGYGLVEYMAGLEELAPILHGPLEIVHRRPENIELLVSDSAGRLERCDRLQRHPGLYDYSERSSAELQQEHDSARENRGFWKRNDRAPAGAWLQLDDALKLKESQGLTKRAASNTQFIQHDTLRRKHIARLKLPSVDLPHDVLGRDLGRLLWPRNLRVSRQGSAPFIIVQVNP